MELELALGPEWLQKILVVSHERSGTHFLMNTIAQNFGYVSADWIDLDLNLPINYWNPKSILEVLGDVMKRPIATLFKSHHPVETFLPIMEDFLKSFFIFYIHRNLEDVMESLCQHLKDLGWNAGPIVKNGKILAKTEPSKGMLRYQWKQYPNCLERWYDHVHGWRTKVPEEFKNRVGYVRFEELDENFDNAVRYIGNFIGLTPPAVPVRPEKTYNVVTPRKEAGNA